MGFNSGFKGLIVGTGSLNICYHAELIFHDSSRQQYGVIVTRCSSYSCFVLLKVGDSDARNIEQLSDKINSLT
jgi:hypothetical protein